MKYKVSYEVNKKFHSRFYNALDQVTALAMFKETCDCGSLIGETPKDIKVKKVKAEKKS